MRRTKNIYKKCEGCGNLFMQSHEGTYSEVYDEWFHSKQCYKNWYDRFRNFKVSLDTRRRTRRRRIFFYTITLLILLYLTTACSITHKHGEKPKVHINNPIADKTTVKFKDKGLRFNMIWYF